ncbi:hypothetical protein D3C78_1173080 [compost metagenome]
MYRHEEDIMMQRDFIAGTSMIFIEDAYPDFPIGNFVTDIIVNNQSVSATAEKYKPEAEASIAKIGK